MASEITPLILQNSKSFRVLIVDDEENISLTLRLGLRKIRACEIEVVNNGPDALQKLKQGSFDLLITDYMMPEMNGLTLISQIKKHEPNLPIIMMTAYHNQFIQEQLRAGAMQHLLHKPVPLPKIRQLVREILCIEE